MEYGLAFHSLERSEYSGKANQKVYERVFDNLGFECKWCRTWENTNLKGINSSGFLDEWKLEELRWKEKFFDDRRIHWQLCVGSFNQYPDRFFDKRLDTAVNQILDTVKPDLFEIANEPQKMWLGSCSSMARVIKRHNQLAQYYIDRHEDSTLVISPYYKGEIYPDPELYKKFLGTMYDRHLYHWYKHSNLPEWIDQIGEADYNLWQKKKYEDGFRHVQRIFYWVDKEYGIPTKDGKTWRVE